MYGTTSSKKNLKISILVFEKLNITKGEWFRTLKKIPLIPKKHWSFQDLKNGIFVSIDVE